MCYVWYVASTFHATNVLCAVRLSLDHVPTWCGILLVCLYHWNMCSILLVRLLTCNISHSVVYYWMCVIGSMTVRTLTKLLVVDDHEATLESMSR